MSIDSEQWLEVLRRATDRRFIVDPNHVGPPLLVDLDAIRKQVNEAEDKAAQYFRKEAKLLFKIQQEANQRGHSFMAGPIQLTDGLMVDKETGEVTIYKAEPDVLCESYVCKYNGRVRCEAADYKPFPYPEKAAKYLGREARGVKAHVARQRQEQREAARKRALVSLREWPLCKFTDTPVELAWNNKGVAMFICDRCYQ